MFFGDSVSDVIDKRKQRTHIRFGRIVEPLALRARAEVQAIVLRNRDIATSGLFQYLSKFLDFRKSSHSFAFLRILSRYFERKTV
jgi:hypothetical protein